jgi:hypothetical protein
MLTVLIGIAFCHGTVFGQINRIFNIRLFNLFLVCATSAAGAGLYFGRSWAFGVAYLILAMNLLGIVTTFPAEDLPYSFAINHLAFIGIPKKITYRLIVMIILLATAWAHWQLHLCGDLKNSVSFGTHPKRLYAIVCVSALLIVAPIVFFIYGMIVDPPTGRHVPAVPSGGILPAVAILFGIPMLVIGAAGIAIVYYAYRRGSRSVERDCDEGP